MNLSNSGPDGLGLALLVMALPLIVFLTGLGLGFVLGRTLPKKKKPRS